MHNALHHERERVERSEVLAHALDDGSVRTERVTDGAGIHAGPCWGGCFAM